MEKAVALGFVLSAALIFHVVGGFGSCLGTEQTRDEMQGKIDAGGDTGRNTELTVIVKTFRRIDDGGRRDLAQQVERAVVGGDLQAVEQAGLGQQQRAGADAGDDFCHARFSPQPF